MWRKLLMVCVVGFISACEQPQSDESGDSHFEQHIKRPHWYTAVEAPALNTIEELDQLWRSKKRCCIDKDILVANNREFYKGCYQGIVNNPKFEELVVKCLWLMGAGADRKQKKLIKYYLVDNYGLHENDTSRCANCAPADTVARVTHDVARIEHGKENTDGAIELLEEVLNRRGSQISPWVQTEMYTTLGQYYLSTTVSTERAQNITRAYQRLAAIATKDNGVVNRIGSLETINQKLQQMLQ